MWFKMLEQMKYRPFGFDLHAPAVPHCYKVDLLRFKLPIPPQGNLVCSDVMKYFPLAKWTPFLKKVWDSFTSRAFIFTPDTPLQEISDPNTLAYANVYWLARQCKNIGGHVIILHYRNDWESGMGPSILWVKKICYETVFEIVLRHQAVLNDPYFHVSIL